MLEITDMNGIRQMARLFMRLDPEPTPLSPMIIRHPFTDCGLVHMRKQAGAFPEVSNIMEDKAAFDLWREDYIREHIDTMDNIAPLTVRLTKGYRMAFLKHAMPYMSQADFSQFLASAWISIEAPNSDPNFTQNQLVKLFKEAAPEHLMTAEDIELKNSLPDTVTIYRGLTEKNAKKIQALSWTLEERVAEWFAQRYSPYGKVYQAEIDKEDILAVFTGRNESEVIVDPKKLKNITEIQDFGEGFNMSL